jgi:hypothetical protein
VRKGDSICAKNALKFAAMAHSTERLPYNVSPLFTLKVEHSFIAL